MNAPFSLAHFKAEALCEHVVRVQAGKAFGSVRLEHDGQRREVRLGSLGSARQDRGMRLALLEWLLELHDKAVA